jgi:hypothetical protein
MCFVFFGAVGTDGGRVRWRFLPLAKPEKP